MNIVMTPADWFNLLAHFAALSLLGVGARSPRHLTCTGIW